MLSWEFKQTSTKDGADTCDLIKEVAKMDIQKSFCFEVLWILVFMCVKIVGLFSNNTKERFVLYIWEKLEYVFPKS